MLTPLISIIDFCIRCLISLCLGSIIGLEREYHRKAAGLKTHVLICIGSTAITYLSYEFSTFGDPSRIAAQIVSGIGFIGAGTILQSRKVVQGLTTAASLWVVAAVGMLVGNGLWVPATVLTLLTTLFLTYTKKFTRYRSQRKHYSLSIEINTLNTLKKIEKYIKLFELKIEQKTLKKNNIIHIHINYSTTPLNNHLFLKRLFSLKGIGEVITI